MERRKATRYLKAAPAKYRWVSDQGVPKAQRGITRDISTSGAFVLAQIHPPLGTQTEVEISLPNLDGTGTGAHLFGVGPVIRAEHMNTNEAGFALLAQFEFA